MKFNCTFMQTYMLDSAAHTHIYIYIDVSIVEFQNCYFMYLNIHRYQNFGVYSETFLKTNFV